MSKGRADHLRLNSKSKTRNPESKIAGAGSIWRRKEPGADTRAGFGGLFPQLARGGGLLLGAEDRVLGGLGEAELHDLLLRDHLLLAGVGAEAHHHRARRPLAHDELADARDGEAVL